MLKIYLMGDHLLTIVFICQSHTFEFHLLMTNRCIVQSLAFICKASV